MERQRPSQRDIHAFSPTEWERVLGDRGVVTIDELTGIERVVPPAPVTTYLTERERRVLYLTYGLGDGKRHKQTEIGQAIDRSTRTVRRTLRSALGKLRNPR